jgi:hypothetical protein
LALLLDQALDFDNVGHVLSFQDVGIAG